MRKQNVEVEIIVGGLDSLKFEELSLSLCECSLNYLVLNDFF